MEDTHEENKYLRAKKRMEEIRKFYTGLMSYLVVIALLAGLNYYLNEWSYPWFLWAAFGWGIGLTFQAAKAFNLNPFFGKDWEERKIEEFMQEDERKSRWE
ncbi:MAG TPA: 2TM domain-containing protein [Pricia sp.]|nr:2TM domain-containing protein [Pricia sp.]